MAAGKSIKEAMKSSETIRMFKNDTLEKLSHVHPATPFVVYIPIVLFALYWALFNQAVPVQIVGMGFLAGAGLWTLAEYVLHRFLFHPPFSDSYLKKLYFFVHGVHHDAPDDATRLVMPPGASIPLATGFFFLFLAVGGQYGLPLFAGFISAYLVYDFLHFAVHFYAFKSGWFRALKTHHMKHHYVRSDKNFGLSSSFWDYIFFTKLFVKKKE